MEYEKTIKCKDCNIRSRLESNCYFDEKGYGYSTKIFRCPHCGKLQIVKYYIDEWAK